MPSGFKKAGSTVGKDRPYEITQLILLDPKQFCLIIAEKKLGVFN